MSTAPPLDPPRPLARSTAQHPTRGVPQRAALRAIAPDDARAHVEQLPGIGPFSSATIVVRSLGHTDVMAATITGLTSAGGELYRLGHPATPDELDDPSRA